MRRSRSKFTILALGVCLVAGTVATLSARPSSAAPKTPAATVITVTAGKPSELAFKLSKFSAVPVGTVTFKVTNEGVAYHTFKICTTAATSATSNTCVGKATPVLKNGQSATLTVKFTKGGKYEYLCTIPGHAAAGMKGLIGIGVAISAAAAKAPAATTTTSASTSTSTTAPAAATSAATTTTPPASAKSSGGATPSECAAGVTIPTSGNADADGDELGTEPSDNDGCI